MVVFLSACRPFFRRSGSLHGPALLLLALLGPVVATAAATYTYRWVDSNGVVHYSDHPPAGAEKVLLPSAQTYNAPPAGTPARAATTAARSLPRNA